MVQCRTCMTYDIVCNIGIMIIRCRTSDVRHRTLARIQMKMVCHGTGASQYRYVQVARYKAVLWQYMLPVVCHGTGMYCLIPAQPEYNLVVQGGKLAGGLHRRHAFL